jgi:hypothetical protein
MRAQATMAKKHRRETTVAATRSAGRATRGPYTWGYLLAWAVFVFAAVLLLTARSAGASGLRQTAVGPADMSTNGATVAEPGSVPQQESKTPLVLR